MTNFVITELQNPQLNQALTVAADIYLGQNQIRRNVGHTISYYSGAVVNDQYVEIAAAAALTIVVPQTKMLVIQVSGPVQVTMTVGTTELTLPVTKLMMIDSGVVGNVIFTNAGAQLVQAHISYAA